MNPFIAQASVGRRGARGPVVCLALGASLYGHIANAQFSDVTVGAGLGSINGTYGVAWGDFNNDGYPDLYVSGEDKLYINDGDGTFSAGPALSGNARSAHWGDFDNDGDLDFFSTHNPLFSVNNGNGTFTLQNNASVGLSGPTNLGDIGWIDQNEDGFLDVWAPDANTGNHIYQNDGDGTFTDQGADALGLTPSSNGETTVMVDYDGDGHTDILYRSTAVVLWRSDGDGTFTNTTATAGISLAGAAGGYNGTAFGDYDGDGDLDLYGGQDGANKLYRNNGNGTFTDVTSGAGVAAGTLDTTGVAWGDHDHDGDVDLYVAHNDGTNHLFRNNGDGTFTDVAASLGVADTGSSYGSVFADFDLDGDLDLFVANTGSASKLYRNDLNDGRSLKVKARGLGSGGAPRDGTGSRVELWNSDASALLAIREIHGGEGYGSHGPRFAHFGLDPSQTYTLKVRYTGGLQVVLGGVVPQSESIAVGATVLTKTVEIVEGAGVNIVQSGASTDVSEAGATSDTYTLALKTQPTNTVTLSVDPDTQVDLGGGAGVAINLSFTTANWSTPQTVTVTAVDDGLIEGAHTSMITHAATSSDGNYNGVSISNVVASVTDDDSAGATIVESSGVTAVSERDTTSDTYTIVLDAQPASDVTITVDPDVQTDLGAGVGAAVTLTFTSANWNAAQTVTVTAADDVVVEGVHNSTISHTVASADGNFNGVTVPDLVAAVVDDDDSSTVVIGGGGSSGGPVANDITVVTQEDEPIDITLSGANAGGTPAYFVIEPPQHGLLEGDPPNVRYTPERDYAGTDGFRYVITSAASGSAPASVSIDVQSVNDAPSARNVSATVIRDLQGQALTLAADDADVDDPHTFTILSLPRHGALAVNGLAVPAEISPCLLVRLRAADRTVNALETVTSALLPLSLPTGDRVVYYTPDPGFAGADDFTFDVDDGLLVSEPATFSISVADAATPSVLSDSEAFVLGASDGRTLTLRSAELELGNLVIQSLPVNGLLVDPETGTIITRGLLPYTLASPSGVAYVPLADYFGEDAFQYFIESDGITSNLANVRLSVVSEIAPPTAIGVVETIDPDEDCVLILLESTPGEGGETLTTVIGTLPERGALIDIASGEPIASVPFELRAGLAVIYMPDPGDSGTVEFTYFVRDELNESAPATVMLRIGSEQMDGSDSPDVLPMCGPCGALGLFTPLMAAAGLLGFKSIRKPRNVPRRLRRMR